MLGRYRGLSRPYQKCKFGLLLSCLELECTYLLLLLGIGSYFYRFQNWAKNQMRKLNIDLIKPLSCTLLQSPLYFKGDEIDSSKMYRTICLNLTIGFNSQSHVIKIMEIHVKPECSIRSTSTELVGASYNANMFSKELYLIYPLVRIDPNDFKDHPERYKHLLVFSGHRQMKAESLKLIGNRKGDLVNSMYMFGVVFFNFFFFFFFMFVICLLDRQNSIR